MTRFLAVVLVVLTSVMVVACTPPVEQAPDVQPAEQTAEVPEKLDELLLAVLKAKNPGVESEIGIRTDEGGNVRVVAVNDPALRDISPLEGMPLVALDLRGCRVSDLGPLRGMPLIEVYLEDTAIEDIGPLKGAPLQKLYIGNTKVKDISALKGADRLVELNAIHTRVSDLSPLEKSPLKMLWVTGCPVSDVTPLQKIPTLVSVTLAETKVSDISPLKGHPLQRLHIAETEVTDLSPLEWMKLTRLIFTPGKIAKGIEHARKMESLSEIGPTFEDRMPPWEFWPMYDRGEFK